MAERVDAAGASRLKFEKLERVVSKLMRTSPSVTAAELRLLSKLSTASLYALFPNPPERDRSESSVSRADLRTLNSEELRFLGGSLMEAEVNRSPGLVKVIFKESVRNSDKKKFGVPSALDPSDGLSRASLGSM